MHIELGAQGVGAAVLKTSFLFSGVSDAVLDDIMNAMYKKRVYEKDIVVTQNDRHSLRAFYVVESGTLTGRDNVKWVENEGDSKSEVETKHAVKVRSYGKGGDRMCFNEQCMAHAQMPHETVTAEEDGSLWVLDYASYARARRDALGIERQRINSRVAGRRCAQDCKFERLETHSEQSRG